MNTTTIAMLEQPYATQGGHWYCRDGTPMYVIVGANGNLRDVTLRDARKHNLVPGVSSIIKQEAAPGLVNWRIDQALMAALTLPRTPGETDQEFMARAKRDASAQAEKARERGTQLHGSIERGIRGENYAQEDEPFVRPVLERLGSISTNPEFWDAERSCAVGLGYGCKVDLVNRKLNLVLDFKTKDFGIADDLPKPYSEHLMQLAANRVALLMPDATCANLFISTRTPGLLHLVYHTEADIRKEWDAFRCLLRLWQIRKNYQSDWS